MKTFFKNAFAIAVVSLFSASLSAADYVAAREVLTEDTIKKGDPDTVCYLVSGEIIYSKIEVNEVPQLIKTAVAGKYAAYTTEEAYKGSDGTYKLVLKREEKKLTVYYSENGEFKKEEAVEKTQKI